MPQVSSLIDGTLQRIGVETLAELAEVDIDHVASAWGVGGKRLELLEALIKQAIKSLAQGADPSAVPDRQDPTHQQPGSIYRENLLELIERSTPSRLSDNERTLRWGLIRKAARELTPEKVKTALAAGANLGARDGDGRTPLMMAAAANVSLIGAPLGRLRPTGLEAP